MPRRVGTTRYERISGFLCAIGGALFTLSLVAAAWASSGDYRSTLPVSLDPTPAPGIQCVAAPVPAPPRTRGDATEADQRQAATSPLGWDNLTLMLRTGLSDQDIIDVAASKQLTTSIGQAQEQVLRQLGAGDRLITYLRSQPVYRVDRSVPEPAPATRNRAVVTAPPAATLALSPPAVPVIDHAARDRQIAALKTRIDQLDEDMRIARSRPQDYHSRRQFQWHGNRVDQTSYDAYLKRLDAQRDDLRRQKWQLEGR